MISSVIYLQRRIFPQRNDDVLRFTNPFPSHIENHLADLILKSPVYQNPVIYVPNTDLM